MREGRGEESGLITQMPQLPSGREEGPMIDYLIETKQKIPDWLRRLKLQLGQVLSPGSASWVLAQVILFWACGFLFNAIKCDYNNFP